MSAVIRLAPYDRVLADPRREIIRARFACICRCCRVRIESGERIAWVRDHGAICQECWRAGRRPTWQARGIDLGRLGIRRRRA